MSSARCHVYVFLAFLSLAMCSDYNLNHITTMIMAITMINSSNSTGNLDEIREVFLFEAEVWREKGE